MSATGSATGIIALSRHGARLARSLATSLEGQIFLHIEQRFALKDSAEVPFSLPLRPLFHELFNNYQRLVLFMPVGAAIRLLAPCLQDKHADPAVVCVDDAGRFAVSLVSGHLGGADVLAQVVAQILGATPVVTSASHVLGTLAVDLLGRELGWTIEAEPLQVTRASAAMVNGERMGIFQDAGEPISQTSGSPWPSNLAVYGSQEELMEADVAAALIVTDREQGPLTRGTQNRPSAWKHKPVVVYRPRSLAVGVGCRRGVPVDELEELLASTFEANNLALSSIRCIATAVLKGDEPGVQELAVKYDVPLQVYTAEELNSVFDRGNPPNPPLAKGGDQVLPSTQGPDEALHLAAGGEETASPAIRGEEGAAATVRDWLSPTPRQRVRDLLGMWGVSEPAALLAA